jgi:Dyp-type peroxidase family
VVARELRRVCRLFAALDSGEKKIDVLDDTTGRPSRRPLSDFDFSATVGFGQGFFDQLAISAGRRPRKLKAMPDHAGLGDVTPYSLGQTDLILQLGSSRAFVNRWVLENTFEPVGDGGEDDVPPDIASAVAGWATITDTHAGFQRTDGRNLQGFNDGVSNPRAGSDLFNEVVWSQDETNDNLNMGTYMVFQKIVHDLDQWRELDVDEQPEWVGRSRGTGLLLGTLTEDEDDALAAGLRAGDAKALDNWKKLFDLQMNQTVPFFTPEQINEGLPELIRQALDAVGLDLAKAREMAERITARCPAWSHIPKVNPRGADGTRLRIMFRRGYPFEETSLDNKIRSGLLFVSFQSDIEGKFEFIKSQWAGNRSFPVPLLRTFTAPEVVARHKMGRLSAAELFGLQGDAGKRQLLGLGEHADYRAALLDALGRDDLEELRGDAATRQLLGLAADPGIEAALQNARQVPLSQQTGREGLAGPSEHGTVPTGEFLAIVPLGGGYYFVPPVPAGGIAEIGQSFFDQAATQTEGTRGRAETAVYRGEMNVVVAPGSRAEATCRVRAGADTTPVKARASIPAAARGHLAAGLDPTPEHNLVFRGGRTLRDLVYVNFYLGGEAAWAAAHADDRAHIDAKFAAALRDPRLEGVIAQYFGDQPLPASRHRPDDRRGGSYRRNPGPPSGQGPGPRQPGRQPAGADRRRGRRGQLACGAGWLPRLGRPRRRAQGLFRGRRVLAAAARRQPERHRRLRSAVEERGGDVLPRAVRGPHRPGRRGRQPHGQPRSGRVDLPAGGGGRGLPGLRGPRPPPGVQGGPAGRPQRRRADPAAVLQPRQRPRGPDGVTVSVVPLAPPPPRSLSMAARQLTLVPDPLLRSRLAGPPPAAAAGAPMTIPVFPEHTLRQNLIFLLMTAAEIEHSLLVEYLYAAYSLRPNTPVPNSKQTTRTWQTAILRIAREEMGHLLTVQNILRYVGGPLHLDREHFPYPSDLYPFPFVLQRLTKKSLAKYLFAEMPDPVPAGTIPPDVQVEIAQFAREDAGGAGLNHVGTLYKEMIGRFGAFQDRDFPGDTGPWQAPFDEWRASSGDPGARPIVGMTVYTVSSVKEAVAALQAIAIQGEGQPTGNTQQDIYAAHFKRFYDIYAALPNSFDPSLPVASNPNTTSVPRVPPADVGGAWEEAKYRNSRITQEVTLLWAHLFNVRYRMLLTDVAHALLLPRAVGANGKPVLVGTPGSTATPRTDLVQWAFLDMKDSAGSLKALAPILNGLDRTDVITDGKAGPPFEMPFSLALPDRPADRWRYHRDLLIVTQDFVGQLLGKVTDPALVGVLQSIQGEISDPAAPADPARSRLARLEQLAASGF